MRNWAILVVFCAGCGALGPKKVAQSEGYTLTVRDNDKDKTPCAQGSGDHPKEVAIGPISSALRALGYPKLEPTSAQIHFAFQKLKSREAICIADSGSMVAGITVRGGALQLWRVNGKSIVNQGQVPLAAAPPPSPSPATQPPDQPDG